TLDLTFCHYVSIAQKDDLIRDHIDLVQNVAGNDDVTALRGRRAEQRDHLRSRQWVEAVERFIENQHFGIVGQGLCEPDSLAHPFTVGGNFPRGSVDHVDSIDRLPGGAFSVWQWHARKAEIRVNELKSRE